MWMIEFTGAAAAIAARKLMFGQIICGVGIRNPVGAARVNGQHNLASCQERMGRD
jgi:hypothetical protein